LAARDVDELAGFKLGKRVFGRFKCSRVRIGEWSTRLAYPDDARYMLIRTEIRNQIGGGDPALTRGRGRQAVSRVPP
jgi:hypothetical protein